MNEDRIVTDVLDRLVAAHAITQEMLGDYTWPQFVRALAVVKGLEKPERPDPEPIPMPLDCEPMRQEVLDYINSGRLFEDTIPTNGDDVQY